MPHPKQLSRADIVRTARRFSWTRKMPKWTVVIEGRELPARPLVLEAAGVAPNDPTNSHQAVAILQGLGFETKYAGGLRLANDEPPGPERPSTSDRSRSIVDLILEISKSVPDEEWKKVPSDLSINHDHYLYGAKKRKS